MDDQMDNLRTVGLDRAVGISGRQDAEEKKQLRSIFEAGHFNFCFVSPERFQAEPFRESLRSLTVNSAVSLIAIDEAHCVSEWGHDFRTAYLNLGRTTREYCSRPGEPAPPLVGLTGTASRVVLKDVQRALDIQGVDAIITPTSFDRPELSFRVVRCSSEEKSGRLAGLVGGLPQQFGLTSGAFYRPGSSDGAAGLIFCRHINGEFGTRSVAETLSKQLDVAVDTYSGSRPRNAPVQDWESHKASVQRAFKRNQVQVLACTKAFGMGIDKPNIRFTIHYGLPATVESFYQEAGRAGRDQKPANCAVILSVDDTDRARRLLDPNTDVQELGREMKDVAWQDADDITRALFFHTSSFAGIPHELRTIRAVLASLTPINPHRRVTLGWQQFATVVASEDVHRETEKAIHHLVTLRVVQDYTVNWAQREYALRLGKTDAGSLAEALGAYGRAYQIRRGEQLQARFEEECPPGEEEGVMFGAELLLEFIYDTVELARRRALSEMHAAASAAAAAPTRGDLLKERVLLYLTQTDWDVRLEELATSGGLEPSALATITEEVVSYRHAKELRGATARQLDSYPDQPSFLLLSAFAEACVKDPNWGRIGEDGGAALRYGSEKYGVSPAALAEAVAALSLSLRSLGRDANRFVRSLVSAEHASREFQRTLCTQLPAVLAIETAPPLLDNLLHSIRSIPSDSRIR